MPLRIISDAGKNYILKGILCQELFFMSVIFLPYLVYDHAHGKKYGHGNNGKEKQKHNALFANGPQAEQTVKKQGRSHKADKHQQAGDAPVEIQGAAYSEQNL